MLLVLEINQFPHFTAFTVFSYFLNKNARSKILLVLEVRKDILLISAITTKTKAYCFCNFCCRNEHCYQLDKSKQNFINCRSQKQQFTNFEVQKRNFTNFRSQRWNFKFLY